MITESKGPWIATARLASWDESGDAVVTLTRKGKHVGTFIAYRFPIGWRCGDLLRTPGLAATGKAVAARAIRQLP